MADFHVPHVLQYIEVKESHGQLKKSVKEWERKVEIAEVRILQTLFFYIVFPKLCFLMTLLFQMALKTYSKTWEKLRITAGARVVPARHAAIDAGLYGFSNNN